MRAKDKAACGANAAASKTTSDANNTEPQTLAQGLWERSRKHFRLATHQAAAIRELPHKKAKREAILNLCSTLKTGLHFGMAARMAGEL